MEKSITLVMVLVLALIILGIGYFVLFPLIDIGGEQNQQAALNACCTKLITQGQCEKDADDKFFQYNEIQCTVHESLDASGTMSLSELVSKSGLSSPQGACCR